MIKKEPLVGLIYRQHRQSFLIDLHPKGAFLKDVFFEENVGMELMYKTI